MLERAEVLNRNFIVQTVTEIERMLETREVALQFVLEEIEAASQGDGRAQKFARRSGFSPAEYENAMKNSRPEVDGPDGPQVFLHTLASEIQDMEVRVTFLNRITEGVMLRFKLGACDDSQQGRRAILPPFDSFFCSEEEKAAMKMLSEIGGEPLRYIWVQPSLIEYEFEGIAIRTPVVFWSIYAMDENGKVWQRSGKTTKKADLEGEIECLAKEPKLGIDPLWETVEYSASP